MGFFDCLCCCFGKRLDTSSIRDMLARDGGFVQIAASCGYENLSAADCTSCNTTAIILGQIIQGEKVQNRSAQFNDIIQALQSRMAVIVNLKPDHWFCVLPSDDDPNGVVLIQSYQNLYDVRGWLTARNGGAMQWQQFRDSLQAILTGSGSPDDAVRLFARAGDEDTIRRDFAVQASIVVLWTVGSFTWERM
jgi:hypothetical protein